MKWMDEFLGESGKQEGAESAKSFQMRPARESIARKIPNTPTPPSAESAKSLESDPDEREALQGADLENRLAAHGISIAIDRSTGCALLLFKPSDAEIVEHLADVYEPFRVELTKSQRQELLGDLNYYEALLRKAKS